MVAMASGRARVAVEAAAEAADMELRKAEAAAEAAEGGWLALLAHGGGGLGDGEV